MATYQGGNAVNLDKKESLSFSINGKVYDQCQVEDAAVRQRIMFEGVAIADTANKYKDRVKKNTESLSSILLQVLQGYYLSCNLPHDFSTWEQGERLAYLADKKIIRGFFESELAQLQIALKGQYTEDFFNKRSSTWASVVSRLKRCCDYGLNPAERYGSFLKYRNIQEFIKARNDAEEHSKAQAIEQAEIKKEKESLTTPQGKIDAICNSITSEIKILFGNVKSPEQAIHIFEAGPVKKLINSLMQVSNTPEDVREAEYNKLSQKISNIANGIYDEEIYKDMETEQEVDNIVDSALENAALREAALEEAYNLGYQSGLDGESKDDNPCEDAEESAKWLEGWKQGMIDS